MGRRRKHRKDLPERVYHRHGTYYFVDAAGKWHRLAKTFQDAMVAYAGLNSTRGPLATLGKIMDKYQAEILPTKALRTQRGYLADMRPLRAAFGQMRPEDLTPPDIYAYMDQRPRVSANREKALLSTVYSYAIRWGAAKDNPCRNVKRNTEKARDRYVTDAEFFAVYDMAPPIIRAAMMLATITGLRLSDLLGLRLSDWSDDGLTCRTGKTGKALMFERTPSLEEAVKAARAVERRAASIYLLASRDGQKYTASGFSAIWQRVIRKAKEEGVIEERFQFRDLRAKSGSDHPDGSHLGHASKSTLQRHYRRRPERVMPANIGGGS